MNKIKITRNTVVKGYGAVEIGEVLEVGTDVSERDAHYLVNIKKAVALGGRTKETAESKKPSQGETAQKGAETGDLHPLIAKAMELTGAETIEDLAAMSDEEIEKVKGISKRMLAGIREVLTELAEA